MPTMTNIYPNLSNPQVPANTLLYHYPVVFQSNISQSVDMQSRSGRITSIITWSHTIRFLFMRVSKKLVLLNFFPPFLKDISLEARRNMLFQLDDFSAHYYQYVSQQLEDQYPNRVLGRGSLFLWPALSPNLTCLDFYLWGRLK